MVRIIWTKVCNSRSTSSPSLPSPPQKKQQQQNNEIVTYGWILTSLGLKHSTVCFYACNQESVSRVAGTMVARSSSVRAVARSNLSQVPPLHMIVGK